MNSSYSFIVKSGKKGKKEAKEDEGGMKVPRVRSAYSYYTAEMIPKLRKEHNLSQP